MEVSQLKVDRKEARERWREYRKHLHYSKPMDEEIAAIHKAIAMGKLVIQAQESIRQAGLGADHRPKLALARADAQHVQWRPGDGVGRFWFNGEWPRSRDRRHAEFQWEGIRSGMPQGKAVVPIVPIHLRPKHALQNYWILWEADWQRAPVDPMLLRRVGRGDAWIVLAQWDLTPVERAVLAQRLNA